MITSRTKKQLIAFVIITLLGVSFVGARYAKLGRLFYDSAYQVDAHFAQSGGIFTGAEVTYRGVGIGRVSDMQLTRDGVDVVLSIEKKHRRIPTDTLALVGNKSAVGEQYVELQPRTDSGPFLKDGSSIKTPDTAVPVSTTELLTNLDGLVRSVPQADLRTVVSELGAAFKGTGPNLGQIIDTSSSFIQTAEANFETTTALLRDGRVVLQGQADKGSAIRAFARDLDLFSGTLSSSDADLRALIDNGSATANELRTFLEQNKVNLGELINNLVTTGEIVAKRLPGIRQMLVVYPYVVAGGFTVAAKNQNGRHDAQFGLVLTLDPEVCHAGYEGTDRRPPQNTGDRPMKENTRCTAKLPTLPRGAQHAPNRPGAAYRAPVATYDARTGKVAWAQGDEGDQGDQGTSATIAYDGGAAAVFGKDSWKTMLLQPSMAQERE